MPETAPWDRQAGEPGPAYHAFTLYRDLGPVHRSLGEVTRIFRTEQRSARTVIIFPDLQKASEQQDEQGRAKKQQRHDGQIGGWSRRWNWVERSQAWDDFLDKSRQRVYRDSVVKMAEQHAQQAELSLALLMQGVRGFAEALKDENRNQNWKQADALTMYGVALEAMKMLPKMQETMRAAKGVRVAKPENEVSPQGGDVEWVVHRHDPPKGTEVDLSEFQVAPQPVHWEGDEPPIEPEDEAEGQAFPPKRR